MSFLPDWAPNLHPLLVHFPIAILFTAVLIDIAGLFLKEQPFWRRAAVLLYVLGGISVFATYLAGEQAADSVFLPSEANALLTEHSDLGQWTFWFYGGYAVLRLIVFLTGLSKRMIVHLPMVFIAAGGLVLLFSTAEHGAELVFRFGVGVQAVDLSVESVGAPTDSLAIALSSPSIAEDSSWSWKPTRATAWRSAMAFVEGESALTSSMMDAGERGDVLGLTVDGEPVLFLVDLPLSDTQVDAAVNLDNFEGIFMFVHNVRDADNFGFMAIGNGQMRQGRSENGDIYVLDTKDFSASGWHTYRVVSDGTHVRAYSGKTLITHGHGEAHEPGSIGIRINGSGTVLLDFLKVQRIR